MTPEMKNVLRVNPKNDVVELRPQELLEVVLLGHKDVKWTNPFCQEPRRAQLKCIRNETFHSDGFDRPKRQNFKLRPQTGQFNVWQHHFWFRFNPGDAQKLDSIQSGYDLAHMIFTVDGQRVGDLKVRLEFGDDDREEYWNLLTQTVFKGIDPLKKEAEYSGIGGRIVALDKGYLFNPFSEQVIFENKQQYMLVEMTEPQASNFKDMSEYRWQVQAAPNTQWHDLSVSELSPRMINCKVVQRFLLKCLKPDMATGLEHKRMGRVLFTLENERRTRHVQFNRMLDVFQTRDREVGQEFCETLSDLALERDDDDYDYNKNFDLGEIVREMERRWTPQKQNVVFTELDPTLENGVRTIKLRDLRRKQRIEVLNPKDLETFSLPENHELVFALACTTNRKWSIEIGGKMLTMDLSLLDGNRQRFILNELPKHQQRDTADEVIFRCGQEIRRLLVKKWVPRHNPYDWSDVDSYSD